MNTEQTIKAIYDDFIQERGISWAELATLQANHAFILEHYHDDPRFCEFAGIDEYTYNHYKQRSK